jgi:hypothetical protein
MTMTATIPNRAAPPGGAALDTAAPAVPNYDLLYLTAAALTFLGALAIVPVRRVR